jgi:pyruvate kinase
VRRTKILATIGPASSAPAVVDRILSFGVDAFRINFSHGTEAEHRATLRWLRAAGERSGREIALVADLQGPKIRMGEIAGGSVRLTEGDEWRLDASGTPGNDRRASVGFDRLLSSVRVGDRLLLGDGAVRLAVTRVAQREIVTVVQAGGTVASHAGVFLPGAKLRTSALGEKDQLDLAVALEEGVDWVALSFVRAASDVRKLRTLVDRAGHSEVGIIAKIERAEALVRIAEIVDVADAIMVARGDLGIEVPLERLAVEQKRLVSAANAAHKPAIVATQMLLSMVASPRPTRAEATDVANAILDGADAVMLSEESATGQFPVEAVDWLDRICRSTEAAVASGEFPIAHPKTESESPDRSVADAAVRLAGEVGATALVTPTASGRTARLVASRRPQASIFAISASTATRRRLALTWGVEALPCPPNLTLEAMRVFARALVAARPGSKASDRVVLTAGYPVEGTPTNLVTVLSMAPSRGSVRPGRDPGATRG